MTPTTATRTFGRGRRRGVAAALTAITLAAAASGCGTTTDTPPAPDGGSMPTSTSAAPPTVCTDLIDQFTRTDLCDVDAVLSDAAAALYSYRPAEQTQKGVNIDSAATLLNPAWVRDLGVSYSALAAVTGADWDRWAAAGTVVDADTAVTADDHPADTDTLVRRVVAVQQSLIAPDGTVIGELPPIALYMTATRANRLAGWAVSGVTVR